MASILLLRHAQASFGTEDYDQLSPLGVRQATIAGRLLAASAGRITRITCGPLRRQRETAMEIAAKLRELRGAAPEVEIDPGLDELRIDEHIARLAPTLSDPNGELAADLAAAKTSSHAHQKVIRRVFMHWQQLGGDSDPETWISFAARAREVIRELMASGGRGNTTVAVSSGALIAAITQHVIGLPDSSAYGLFEVMKNCSITQFLYSRGRISLCSFNDTTYLAALDATQTENSIITYR
jgi:broad specificity phosphatase PhoE